jgi:hypothetical protein
MTAEKSCKWSQSIPVHPLQRSNYTDLHSPVERLKTSVTVQDSLRAEQEGFTVAQFLKQGLLVWSNIRVLNHLYWSTTQCSTISTKFYTVHECRRVWCCLQLPIQAHHQHHSLGNWSWGCETKNLAFSATSASSTARSEPVGPPAKIKKKSEMELGMYWSEVFAVS